MNQNTSSKSKIVVRTLAFAAAGIIAGAAMGCTKSDQPNNETKAERHACKGQNACKGQGGCKTDKNACKGQNACKSQGGCTAK